MPGINSITHAIVDADLPVDGDLSHGAGHVLLLQPGFLRRTSGSHLRAAAPGNTITVRGDHWAAECNDVIACSIGCLGKETCTGGEPTPPAQNLRILLATVAPKHDRIELASGVDATANTFTVEHDVGLPENLDPGRYRVLMGNEALGSYRSDIIVIERRPAP